MILMKLAPCFGAGSSKQCSEDQLPLLGAVPPSLVNAVTAIAQFLKVWRVV